MAWINDWAPHQGIVDGNVRPVEQQGFDLFWKDTPLQSVKGCDMLPLVPGSFLSPLRFSGSFGKFPDVWLLFRPIPRIFPV